MAVVKLIIPDSPVDIASYGDFLKKKMAIFRRCTVPTQKSPLSNSRATKERVLGLNFLLCFRSAYCTNKRLRLLTNSVS